MGLELWILNSRKELSKFGQKMDQNLPKFEKYGKNKDQNKKKI